MEWSWRRMVNMGSWGGVEKRSRGGVVEKRSRRGVEMRSRGGVVEGEVVLWMVAWCGVVGGRVVRRWVF